MVNIRNYVFTPGTGSSIDTTDRFMFRGERVHAVITTWLQTFVYINFAAAKSAKCKWHRVHTQ